MCYKLEWFRWKRVTEAERRREQLNAVTESRLAKTPAEPITPTAQSDPPPKTQEELEPV